MKSGEVTGYELSRSFFDWSFENPDIVNPTVTALFFFAIEHCNRLGWKQKFGLPSQMAMDAIGLKTWRTYKKALGILVEYGFFEMVEKSKNQYSANIISLHSAYDKKSKALSKAMQKHSQKHSQKQSSITIKSTVKSKASINKPNNQEPNNHITGEQKNGNFTPLKNNFLETDFENENHRGGVTEVMEHYVEVTGRSLPLNHYESRQIIEQRLCEGHSVDELKQITELRTWEAENSKDPARQRKFLMPKVLFGEKQFHHNLNDVKDAKKGYRLNGESKLEKQRREAAQLRY